jgi:predicted Rossmann fold nucleotide-binding protein DprA/Smf involved in DNA uptake
MHSHHVSAALVTAALLAQRTELSAIERSRVISCTLHTDVQNPDEALEAVVRAFRQAELPFPWQRGPAAASLSKAVKQGEEWARSGITVISKERIRPQLATLHEVPDVLFACGDCSLLELPAAAILNSRKPLQISPDDAWIRATRETVFRARADGMPIVSSYGNIAYAMTSWLAKGSPVIAVCDGPLPFMESAERCESFLKYYDGLFDLNRTLFVSSFPPGRLSSRVDRLPQRDRLVATLASLVMAADVRPHGNMAAILELVARRGIPVVQSSEGCSLETDRIEPARSTTAPLPGKMHGACSQSLEDLSTYVFHYARSCPGPWPGQTLADYCRSLAEGLPESRHTAFDTLLRILNEGLIRGSSRLTRGPLPMVSFTECLPAELERIIRWRPGLVRWSFEPYGLGVPKDILESLGARPVVYGDESALAKVHEEDRPFFQVGKPEGPEWADEREWRLKGDMDLRLVPRERLVIIVRTLREAAATREHFGGAVIALESCDEGRLTGS